MIANHNLLTPDFIGKPGKTELPNNLDAECEILGAILSDSQVIGRVVDLLEPAAFYLYQHQLIYRAMVALYGESSPVDLTTVSTWLEDHKLLEKAGGTTLLFNLLERSALAFNVDSYAILIADKYRRRKLIQAGQRVIDNAHNFEIPLHEALDSSERAVFEVSQSADNGDVEDPLDICLRIYQNAGIRQTGISTGIAGLDRIIGGLKRKKLYVVAGRSGMGKTHKAISLVSQALEQIRSGEQQGSVVCFSAEMDRDSWMTRLLAWKSGVDSRLIEEGRLTDERDFEKLGEAVSDLSDCSLWVDDCPGSALTPTRIRSTLRRATAKYGKPCLVVLDYIQLLGSEDAYVNRVTELSKIVAAIKGIAVTFDVPFVALAQINRTTETQKDKRPDISQLRESGAIEQAADVILLLYRDEYYNPNSPDRGIAEIIVGKQRSGRTGMVKCLYTPETSRFDDYGM